MNKHKYFEIHYTFKLHKMKVNIADEISKPFANECLTAVNMNWIIKHPVKRRTVLIQALFSMLALLSTVKSMHLLLLPSM